MTDRSTSQILSFIWVLREACRSAGILCDSVHRRESPCEQPSGRVPPEALAGQEEAQRPECFQV